MPDHAQLLAEIERRERIARAYWSVHRSADALRRYAHYRRILDRHAPSDAENVWEHGESHPACTHGYDDPDDNPEALQWRQCPEVRDLAQALGVPIEG